MKTKMTARPQPRPTPTKTDFQAVMELRENYTPARRGIVSRIETETIQEVLELSQCNNIELQNIRDIAVMLYSKWADTQREKNNTPARWSSWML